MFTNTLRRKMITFIALPTLIIYVGIIGFVWTYLSIQQHQEIESEMQYLSAIYADKFNDILVKASNVADVAAGSASIIETLTEEKIFQLLENSVKQMPFNYGACMAFEPGTFLPDDSLYAPYVYRNNGDLKRMNITRDVYDWYDDPQWEWFRVPKQLGHGYWTKPYYDEEAGNVRMITYSVPFYRQGKFAGVVTVDIHLRRLKETIEDDILDKLKFEVLTFDGSYIYSDHSERILHKTVYELAEEYDRPEWIALAKKMVNHETGTTIVRGFLTSEKYRTFYAPIQSTGWSFVCRIPEKEMLAGIRKRQTIALIGLTSTLVLIVGSIVFVSGLISKPIAHLNQKVLEVAEGNLDVQIENIHSHDEIGTLSQSFNKMTADLRSYVEKVSELAKLQRDLQLAREIQQRTLPQKLPRLKGFDIEAWNNPAEETGGDTYDVIGYNISLDNELTTPTTEDAQYAIVLLADATGHGIGPALSVTQLRAMLRMATRLSPDISVTAEYINEQLCADLPDGRFITAWLGEIDTAKKILRYFSAGQAPLIYYQKKTNQAEVLPADSFPLGIVDTGFTSIVNSITMSSGDIFAVISDGIYESRSPQDEEFGNERVTKVLIENNHRSAKAITEALRASVLEFTHNAPAEDDRTIIIIKCA